MCDFLKAQTMTEIAGYLDSHPRSHSDVRATNFGYGLEYLTDYIISRKNER